MIPRWIVYPMATLFICVAGCNQSKNPPEAAPSGPPASLTDNEAPPADFIAVDKPPAIVNKVQPRYPELAVRAGMEGKVWVKIWVDKEGRPRQAVVIKSEADVFNGPAVEAAQQFRFTPAMKDGQPVAVWVSVPFKFKLADKDTVVKESMESTRYKEGYIAGKKEAVTILERRAAEARSAGNADTKLEEEIKREREEIRKLEQK